MLTFQDLQAVPDSDRDRADFVRRVINEHKSGELYQTAKIADEYDRGQNTSIMNYQKTLRDVSGRIIPDKWSPNHKAASNFFNIFVTQLNQYLLANGVNWENPETADKLGKDFDTRLQEAGKAALCGGVSFGFWNLDHLEVFDALKFAPLYDEENGALSAGVRFWQVDSTKPLRATLYELDGYTHFLWQTDTAKEKELDAPWIVVDGAEKGVYKQNKVPYKIKAVSSIADGTQIYDGENYPTFPIVPFWGNPHKQSELIGMREKIDAYDLVMNGFANDLDNAQLFWVIKGAGGMDDVDLAQFLRRLMTVRAAAPTDGQDVEAIPVEIPHQAREILLGRLEKQLYRDAMILDPEEIASGAATATQIRAAYERQNIKADQFEYCAIEFISGILAVAGIDDTPTFTRSSIVDKQGEIQALVMAATYLSSEYITRKILATLGDGDKADEILEQMENEEMERAGLEAGGESAGADIDDEAAAGLDEEEDTEIEDALAALEAELDALFADEDEEEDEDEDEEDE